MLWNNSCTIILRNFCKMDLFRREKFKSKLYQIYISDFKISFNN